MKHFNMRCAQILLMSAMLMGAAATTAFAETEITKIHVTFSTKEATGDVAEPTVSVPEAGTYEIVEVDWDKNFEKWSAGSAVTAKVTLAPANGYSFKKNYAYSECIVSGADYISAKGTGNVVVRATYIPKIKLATPERLGFSDANPKIATWKSVKHADTYKLRLYGPGGFIKTFTVNTTSLDLTQYMAETGTYYYELCAQVSDSIRRKYVQDSDWIESGGYMDDTVTDDGSKVFVPSEETSVVTSVGDTSENWHRFLNGRKFKTDDGVYVVNQWYRVLDTWYYFNAEGFAVTGWFAEGGKHYYMNANGAMQTG